MVNLISSFDFLFDFLFYLFESMSALWKFYFNLLITNILFNFSHFIRNMTDLLFTSLASNNELIQH